MHQQTLMTMLFLLMSSIAFSQKYTISGQINDASNGEDIAFANVVVQNLENEGTTSNVYGFYSITLEEGQHTIRYQYLGYQSQVKQINLTGDLKINIELSEDSETLTEVVVTGEREDQNISRNDGSVTTLSMKEVKEIPVLGGEPDILKIMELNPGVKTAGEGNAGFYVRGGGLDQNLVLLDEAPVYNPSHFLGFFSVFNGDALKGATLYKGGMSAEYGGRTSSVMDIRMKDGNNKKYGVSGGIGLIASRLTLEGPIVKDQGSFMISGRRTYADLFLGLTNNEQFENTKLYFYDLNAKANYRITEKDRIYLSGYFGRDEFGFDNTFGLNWGNATGTFRWNHVWNDRLFSNTTLIYSDYDYQFEIGADEDRIALQSVINDINVKQDFSWFPNNKNQVKFGINAIQHTIEPGNLETAENSGFNSEDEPTTYGIESAIYIQNEQEVTDRLKLNYGLRYSLFNRLGNGTELELNEEGAVIGRTVFDNREIMETYGGFEPRLSANYQLDKSSALKLGYNRNYQYLHLLTNATSSTPTDRWVMSSNNIKPQIADQIALGYFKNLKDNAYETSVEVYYKDMQNVIEYRTGANVIFNEEIESDLVYGDGEAYGIEFLLKKNTGKLTGWLGYTLSRTTRTFDEINQGERFSARQDRTHDISLVARYEINSKVSISGNYIYYTGDAVTFPTGRYTVNGSVVPLYTERNGYRMPDYHRLDLGVNWITKKTNRFEGSWNFSLYNAFGRENAYSISFQPNEENPAQTEAVQLSLFKWVPSATYNFKF